MATAPNGRESAEQTRERPETRNDQSGPSGGSPETHSEAHTPHGSHATDKTARQKIAALLWWSVPSSTDEEAKTHTEQLLNDHHAEVVAERDAEIMRWLGKKAREYRATGRKADRARADLITVLASKISRGAVRPNNVLLPAGVGPLFFEPGRTYTHTGDGTDWRFRVDSITTHPEDGARTALGWRHFRGVWEPYAYDEDDWELHQAVGITEAEQAPASQHYDKVPDPADGCHWCACGSRWPCKDAPAAGEVSA